MADKDEESSKDWAIMSEEEKSAVEELRKNCQDIKIPILDVDPKLSLLRFIRARQGNLKKAEAMMRKTAEFRGNCADNIFHEFEMPEVLDRYFPGSVQTPDAPLFVDKLGRPIVYEALGQVDPSGIVNATKAGGDNFMAKYNTYNMEHLLRRCRELTKKSGKPVCQAVIIEDVKGLCHRHLFPAGLALFGRLTRVMEDHYPEIMGVTYVINAPSIFTMIWGIVKKFFDERTRDKIHILGTDYLPTLLKTIDKSQIPVELGGTSTQMKYPPEGGIIPERYFLPEAIGFTKVNIGRRAQETASVALRSGDVAHWEFYSGGRDVGFDLQFDSGDADVEEIRAWSRVTEGEGTYTAKADGTLRFNFDNRFSMMRSKEVTYRVRKNLMAKKNIASAKVDEKGE